MPNDERPAPPPLSRRTLLRSSGAALLIPSFASLFTLAGCGGGGGNAGPTQGVPLQGRLGAEIGGQQLSAGSVLRLNTVGADRNFDTIVAEAQSQFVVVVDGEQKTRGLAVNPGTSSFLAIDAESTASALCFLAPNAVTGNPERAAQRLADIRSRPGFPALADHLREKLPTQSLETIVAGEECQALQTQVLEELTALGATDSRGVEPVIPDFKGSVGVKVNATAEQIQGNPANVPILIENGGWRNVVFFVEPLRDGVPLPESRYFPGGPPFAVFGPRPDVWDGLENLWSMFIGNGSIDQSVDATLPLDLSPTYDATLVRLHMVGMGRAALNPDPVRISDDRYRRLGALAYWTTVWHYVVFPIFETVLGDKPLDAEFFERLDAIISGHGLAEDFYEAVESHNFFDAARVVQDVVEILLDTFEEEFFDQFGLGKLARAAARGLFLLARTTLLVNLTTAVSWWAASPRYCMFEVVPTGLTEVEIK